jgi:hypothetical protein
MEGGSDRASNLHQPTLPIFPSLTARATAALFVVETPYKPD